MMNPKAANIGWRKVASISLLAFVLGFMLVLQIRTVSPAYKEMISQQSDTDRAAYLLKLYNNVIDLREQVGNLSTQINSYKTGQDDTAKLLHDVNDMQAQNGAVAVAGPGVTVEINGEATMFDLQDLINELRNAGAEAIALNGKRIMLRTVIGGDGSSGYVSIDGEPVHGPYKLEAVGSPSDLQTALERKGGLKQLLENKQGLTVKVARSEKITLPRNTVDYTMTYAKPAIPTPKPNGTN
ncbi:MAG: hypothetical protein DLM69_05360 [Candidatus Chloroheliales bacterium]|nr:MAG: hypothetical protein DLM69_05360 [Chloroflexota bacterium]